MQSNIIEQNSKLYNFLISMYQNYGDSAKVVKILRNKDLKQEGYNYHFIIKTPNYKKSFWRRHEYWLKNASEDEEITYTINSGDILEFIIEQNELNNIVYSIS